MYPPEPWELRGQMYLSVFAVPVGALPPLAPPLTMAVRPVRLGGRALVGAAWVRYEPGGTLHYRELLAAVLVHERGRPRVSITDIWVDSVPSRDGGRALWGIPKELAAFDVHPLIDRGTAVRAWTEPGATLATASITQGWHVPGRWPTPLSVVQALDGQVRRTVVRGRSAVRIGGARWQIEPGGALGYLAGRRPLLTLTLADFRMRFGGDAAAGDGTDPAAPR